MDSPTIILLSLIPLTVFALTFASMLEKKEKSDHGSQQSKAATKKKVVSLSSSKK